jgi:putative ABC transport system substrate-binding protein
VVELYSGEGNRERYAELAREVVQGKPDLIFAQSVALGRGLQSATGTIPIVLTTADPVAYGFAASLARPGGNITGVSVDAALEIWSKRLALLKEAVPTLSRVACLAWTHAGWDAPDVRALREAAQQMGVSLVGALLDSPIQDAEY